MTLPTPRPTMRPMRHLFGILALSILAACAGGTPSTEDAPSGPVAGYEGLEDGGFYIEPVDASLLKGDQRRTEVDYAGDEPVGSIVIDIYARKLYHIQEGGRAMRYSIAVGREGLSFTGTGQIQRKAEWPSWQPTANMLRTRPDLYAEYANGRPGGADNPLGARALYLYRGGKDTYFRIHGTIQNESIGRATSAGCIRLFNQDIIHLYDQIKLGTQVKVRTLAESLKAEGPYMDDPAGFAVPNTAENAEAVAKAQAAKALAEAKAAEEQAKAEERAAKERERADRKRLRECKAKNIDELLCPPLPEEEKAEEEEKEFVFKPAIREIGPEKKEDAAAN